MKNLAAYTASQPSYKTYPQYVSINQDDDGSVAITVRSPESLDSVTACAVLTADEFIALIASCTARIG